MAFRPGIYHSLVCKRTQGLCNKELTMDKSTLTAQRDCGNGKQQEIFVDGHRVVIRYGERKNPSAIKAIKSALLAGVKAKKS